MVSPKIRFSILVSFVMISGFAQGMLLPLLAIILEQNGVPSSVNGLHATGLYIGVLIASPFMEKPLQKVDYKPLILIGGFLMFTALMLSRFSILVSFVMISGFAQGMLLPLLAIILEQNGVPSSVNGLHATGLYIGVLIASPFMEKPLQKVGYKPIILIGGFLMFTALMLF